jgi:hypothetical protein
MSEPPIACSLSPGELADRKEEWTALRNGAREVTSIPEGVRLRLAEGASATIVADLVARELACCPFFDFSLHVSRDGVVLEVRAPEAARAIVDELLGDGPRARRR